MRKEALKNRYFTPPHLIFVSLFRSDLYQIFAFFESHRPMQLYSNPKFFISCASYILRPSMISVLFIDFRNTPSLADGTVSILLLAAMRLRLESHHTYLRHTLLPRLYGDGIHPLLSDRIRVPCILL